MPESQNNRFQVTRRSFAAGSLAVGAALSSTPVSAAFNKVSIDSIEAGPIAIRLGNQMITGYRAKPANGYAAPVKLVLLAADEPADMVCCELAEAGYYAIAPALSDDTSLGDPLSNEDVMRRLEAALTYAAGDNGDSARTDIMGFCWGICVIHQPFQSA